MEGASPFEELFRRLEQDYETENFAAKYCDKLYQLLLPREKAADIMATMKLSEASERLVTWEKGCQRVMIEGDSMACNLDRKNKYGMKYFCQHCFGLVDHSGQEVRFVKSHGICQNVMADRNIDEDARRSFEAEVESGAKAELFASLKTVIADALCQLFKHTDTLAEQEAGYVAEETFEAICDLLTKACELAPAFTHAVTRALTDALSETNSKWRDEGCENLLDVYFFLNSTTECLPMYSPIKLFSYLTISEQFNFQCLVSFFRHIEDTYFLNPEDARTIYIQTIYRMIIFDDRASARYVQSEHFRECIQELQDFFSKKVLIEQILESPALTDYFIFSCEQINQLFEKLPTVEALIASPESLSSYFSLHIAMQRHEPITSTAEEYLTSEIEMLDVIVQIHDTYLMSATTIISRLWASTRRQELLMQLLEGLFAAVSSSLGTVEHARDSPSLMLPIQRLVSLIVVAMLTQQEERDGRLEVVVHFTREKLHALLFEQCRYKQMMQQFLFIGVREVVQAFGFYFEVGRKVWARYGDDELRNLANGYRKIYFTLWDCDIFFLKVALLFIQEKDLNKLHQYFSSYEEFSLLFQPATRGLLQQTEEAWFEKCFLLYKDFWSFFNYVLVDEFSVYNVAFYSIDESLVRKKENGHLAIFSEIKELAKTILFCMGSCSAIRLSELAFWFIPFRTPFLHIVQKEMEYDERTYIFRLPQASADEVLKSLKFELLYRDSEVQSETYAKLEERKLEPSCLLTNPKPLKLSANQAVLRRVFESGLVQDSLGLLSRWAVEHDLLTQLLPTFVRLTNNYLSEASRLQARAIVLEDNFCFAWATIDMRDKKTLSMVTTMRDKLKGYFARFESSLMQEELPTAPQPDAALLKAAQKRKMEEKLAKAKSKMRATCEAFKEQMNTVEETSSKLDLRICGFCMQEIDPSSEVCLPIYVRINRNDSSLLSYPLITSCGHSLHRQCFTQYIKQKKHKKSPIWTHQSRCLQCKVLTNSYICRRSTYIDVDYLKKSVAELSENVESMLHESARVDCHINNSLIYLLEFLCADRDRLQTGLLMTHYVDSYALLLEHLINCARKSKAEELNRMEAHIDANKTKHGETVKLLLAGVLIDRDHLRFLTSDELFAKIVAIFTETGLAGLGVLRVSTVILSIVRRGWMETVSAGLLSHLYDVSSSEWESVDVFAKQLFNIDYPSAPAGPREDPLDDACRLEPVFTDAVAKDLHLGCAGCKRWPEDNSRDLLMCLLCGERTCKHCCAGGQDKSNQARHALLKHGGAAIFLSMIDGRVVVVEPPLRNRG